VPDLRGIAAAIGLALLLAAGLASCGESNAKRSVNARAEALSFFAKDAPVVALLKPQPPAEVAKLDRAAAGLPAWQRLRGIVLGSLHDAGLGRSRLRNLVRPGEEAVEGVDASAMTVGAATPDDLTGGFPLLVLATDQADLLSTYVRRTAAAGGLQPRGVLDDARLYEGRTASFAVRDGVLVSAPSLGLVRSAIARRDGDSDLQLDDDTVNSLFEGLDQTGPLLVYADLGKLLELDLGLKELGVSRPWTTKLGETGVSLRAVGNAVQVEAVSKSTDDLTLDDPPLSAEPTPFEFSGAQITNLVRPGPAADLLTGITPISGEGTATSDEIRIHATVGG
jgi:hypothetical protein